ncbi:MAG TPA: hypothetical protein IAA04_11105 [Candidatus Lachnoclostridium pullistercoris]|uniref:Type II secretion system protein GspF domain-containing protein n=1 Tax=Candidatus Lachnoclostridium pullistercoris TaxID=2838632 RepID=A0A9D2PE75_9FIRM|nr:hypothetical protein [Candidatus Lachnoclostridium pullistercoris]
MEKNRRRKLQFICIAAGFVLYGAALAAGIGREDAGVLKRGLHGEGTTVYPVAVRGLLEEETKVEIPVSEQSYSEEEAEELFDRIQRELPEEILGENESLAAVRTDLNLISYLDEYGVEISWRTDGERIDSFGTVYGEGASPEGEEVWLEAELSDGSHQAVYEFPVTVLPPARTAEEQVVERFLEEVREADETQRGENFTLPEQFEGRELAYRETEGQPLWALPFFGILAAVFLETEEKEQKKRARERRERELLRDYPEVVSKLAVFLGAGLTVRGAWEQVVESYERNRREGGRERFAYEEMRQALEQMEKKVPEGKAYQEFGRSCGLQPYLKLAGLLEQNRREGTKNLRGMMGLEMASAFEERKNLARKQGEEAGTKLLLPLFLMLGVVMAMVMAPALLSF